MRRLVQPKYLAFPFRVEGGVATANRVEHVRQLIMQVIFTDPGERVFRPEFGAGVRSLVFEPNSEMLRQLVRKRLTADLSEVLRGEVDPRTLAIEVKIDKERLVLEVSYQLARIDQTERHSFDLGSAHG